MPLPSTDRTVGPAGDNQTQQQVPCHLSVPPCGQGASSSLTTSPAAGSPPRRPSSAGTPAAAAAAAATTAAAVIPGHAQDLAGANGALMGPSTVEPPCRPSDTLSGGDEYNTCDAGSSPPQAAAPAASAIGGGRAAMALCCGTRGRVTAALSPPMMAAQPPGLGDGSRHPAGGTAGLALQNPIATTAGLALQNPVAMTEGLALQNPVATMAVAGGAAAAAVNITPGSLGGPPPPPQRPDTPSSYETPSAAAAAVAAAGGHGHNHFHGHMHERDSPLSASRSGRSRGHSLQPDSAVQSPAQQHHPHPQQQLQIDPQSPILQEQQTLQNHGHHQQEQRRRSAGSSGVVVGAWGAAGGGGWPSHVAAAAASQSWNFQQQQQQQQNQQQQQSAAVAGLPLLAIPAAALPYTPWGPVLPAAMQLPPVAAAAAAATAATAAAAAALHVPPTRLQFAPLPLAPAPAGPAAAARLPPPQAAPLPGSAEDEADLLASQCRLAGVLRQSGKPGEALALLEGVLLRQPGNVEAQHLRAQCQQALGQVQEAMSTHARVLALAPEHTASLMALGALYQAQGLLGDAVAAYRRAHELRPEDAAIREGLAVVLTDQGTKLKNAGAPVSEAVARYQAAVALCPGYAPALYNLGVVAGELRQGDAAVEYYRAALAAEPRYAQAHCNLGVLLRERGRLAEAVAAYEAALAAAPNFTIVRNNLAIALTDLGTHVKNEGRLDDGIALYERALSYAPRHADALYNLGVAYGEKGNLQRAAFMYEMALTFNPGCAEAHNNLGVIWKEQDNIERAVECYSAALAIRPNFPQSLNNLGVVMTAQGRAADALALLTAAVTGSPSYTEAHNNLGVLQRDVGCIPDALASYGRCLALDPHCRNAGQNRLLALNYIHPGEDEQVSSAHREWGELFQSTIQPLPPLGPGDRSSSPDRPLRIGYISPDLFTHSVSYFAEAPLSHHSPARGYQHFVYSCVPKPDAKTGRLRSAVEAAGGVWREVVRLSEGELAEAVRQDKVDLLLELTGHTANNRLGVMARRPAPVQLTWIGYPNSTGLRAVDYRITDEVCDPWDTKQTFVEELVRLPGGCFLCYTPAVDAPPVAPPPALTNGYITFGSFNNLAKITPQVLRLWGAILAAVPRSRLVLKNKPFACEAARAHVLQQLAAVGVEPWRVDLLPLAPGNTQHLATYALMDISLDPFPYAGTTTTTESLYMGVPCLTLAGRCHAHNVGVSLLTAVGLHTLRSCGVAAAGAAAEEKPNGGAATPPPSSPSQAPASNQSPSPPPLQQQTVAMTTEVEGRVQPRGDRQLSAAGAAVAAAAPAGMEPAAVAAVSAGCGGGGARPGWVAHSETEYVALAVAHASDVTALAQLRLSLRERMLSSPLCDGPNFVRRLEDVYRALWRRHCAQISSDFMAADAVAKAAGLRRP